jgi:fumarylacetoacetase
MNHPPDGTHDPRLVSWVESANNPATPFPIQNLPYGIHRRRGEDAFPGAGVAIGDMILDLSACARQGYLSTAGPGVAEACTRATLNDLMRLPAVVRRGLRRRVSDLLAASAPERDRLRSLLMPIRDAELLLPAAIGDYTDFYASIHHATHVGSMFRPDQPLLPNYRYVPIGYHGRASSVVVSGTGVHRPSGQTKEETADVPQFGPTRQLDYELEVGWFVGPGNPLGVPIPIAEADDHLFGVTLLNDWSARDIQKWEYVPLGPFLAKNFATTISPWVVTMDALAPFRAPAAGRASSDPPPLNYLSAPDDQQEGALDVVLEVFLETPAMRTAHHEPFRVSRVNLRGLYWTPAQMVAHHTGNGCSLQSGDLLGSGTVSGPERDTQGCLLEVTRRGREPLLLPGGEVRTFLEDGDEVILRAYCEREGVRRIGFGECRGRILSAVC